MGDPPSPNELVLQVASGFMSAKQLLAASEIGLFEALADGPLDVNELEEALETPRRSVRLLANAMVAMGVLGKDARGRYVNGAVAARYLAGRSPTDLRPLLRYWNRMGYPDWDSFEVAARSGQPTAEEELTDEELDLTLGAGEAMAFETARALAGAYDFAAHPRVLDLGGGSGVYLKQIISQHADTRGVLFEQPQVAAVAGQRLDSAGLSTRIDIVEGDFLEDAIPGGDQLVLIANVARTLSARNNVRLLSRTRVAQTPGTRLLYLDHWTDDTGTEPQLAAVLGGELLMATAEGQTYPAREARRWLEDTGWNVLEHFELLTPSSAFLAVAV